MYSLYIARLLNVSRLSHSYLIRIEGESSPKSHYPEDTRKLAGEKGVWLLVVHNGEGWAAFELCSLIRHVPNQDTYQRNENLPLIMLFQALNYQKLDRRA